MKATESIAIDRTPMNKSVCAQDLPRHSDSISLIGKKGLKMEAPIKWTKKMKQALNESEFKIGNIDNFWDE